MAPENTLKNWVFPDVGFSVPTNFYAQPRILKTGRRVQPDANASLPIGKFKKPRAEFLHAGGLVGWRSTSSENLEILAYLMRISGSQQ
jgi:hypothetical protein